MRLCDSIGIRQKDIISIVGAGGKTSFLFQLAQELKEKEHKVLLTTTTKIYVPEKNMVDLICVEEKNFIKNAEVNKVGIFVYGSDINSENKMIGLTENQIGSLTGYFDYTVIEADGAKKKRIKGWNREEPVIYSGTTKTIGILDIQVVGMEVCEENVFRSQAFCDIANAKQGEHITMDHLSHMICHPKGLFQYAEGEKILFINKVDNPYYFELARGFVLELRRNDPSFLSKILIGSLRNHTWNVL